jgi:hypothetical protein
MGIVEVPLSQGYVAIIDAADAEQVLAHKWHVMRNKNTCYAVRNLPWNGGKRPCQLMHRLIMGVAHMHVDHRDGDGLNNRRTNLRLCTRSQNLGNSRCAPRNTSGFKGVRFNRRIGRYYAQICVDHRSTYLGSYVTAEEAHAAYVRAAREKFGAFARAR